MLAIQPMGAPSTSHIIRLIMFVPPFYIHDYSVSVCNDPAALM